MDAQVTILQTFLILLVYASDQTSPSKTRHPATRPSSQLSVHSLSKGQIGLLSWKDRRHRGEQDVFVVKVVRTKRSFVVYGPDHNIRIRGLSTQHLTSQDRVRLDQVFRIVAVKRQGGIKEFVAEYVSGPEQVTRLPLDSRPSRPKPAILNVKKLQVGQRGEFIEKTGTDDPAWTITEPAHFQIVSIVDTHAMIVAVKHALLWVCNVPTANLADGMFVILPGTFEITGTKRYESIMGPTTVLVAKPVSDPTSRPATTQPATVRPQVVSGPNPSHLPIGSRVRVPFRRSRRPKPDA